MYLTNDLFFKLNTDLLFGNNQFQPEVLANRRHFMQTDERCVTRYNQSSIATAENALLKATYANSRIYSVFLRLTVSGCRVREDQLVTTRRFCVVRYMANEILFIKRKLRIGTREN